MVHIKTPLALSMCVVVFSILYANIVDREAKTNLMLQTMSRVFYHLLKVAH
jgi:hypothetical protein